MHRGVNKNYRRRVRLIDDYTKLTNHLHYLYEIDALQTTADHINDLISAHISMLSFYFLFFINFSVLSNKSDIMTANASLLAAAGVPAFLCPQGTKVHILNLGTMRLDAGW